MSAGAAAGHRSAATGYASSGADCQFANRMVFQMWLASVCI